MQLHARGVKAAAADLAAPHALSVVVKPLHHLLFVHAKSMTFFGILAAGVWSGLQRIDLFPKKFQAALVCFLHAALCEVVDYAMQLRLHALLLNEQTRTACQLQTVLEQSAAHRTASTKDVSHLFLQNGQKAAPDVLGGHGIHGEFRSEEPSEAVTEIIEAFGLFGCGELGALIHNRATTRRIWRVT